MVLRVILKKQKLSEEKVNPRVKEVIALLGAGTILAASVVFPGLPIALKTVMDDRQKAEWKRRRKKWERFNKWRLRAILKRLHQQKVVKIEEKDGQSIISLTEKGKTKYLKYKLEEMVVKKPPKWDGKWRLVIYDIAKTKRNAQQAFRETIKRLKFLCLQKSVYLYPYPCEDEIEFLRQYYQIGDGVVLLTIEGLENEEVYKKYFGL